MWAQTAVAIDKKHRHIIRRIVKYDEIRRSVAINVTDIQVIANPEIFQNTGTMQCACRLKCSVTVPQRRSNQFCAEGLLLHNHPEIEQTVVIEIGYPELIRPGRANDRSSKR